MRKVQKSASKEYAAVRLFRDDVEEIYSLVKKTCGKCSIIVEDSDLDDIKEIKDIENPNTHVLKINGSDPYFSLELSKSHASIYIGDNSDMKAKGLFAAIDSILSRRGRILRALLSRPIYIAYFITFGFLIFWVLPARSQRINFLVFQSTIAVFFTYMLMWLLGFRQTFEQHSIICLTHSSEAGFFRRNKDTLIVGIIVAVVGAVIGAIMLKL